MRAYVAGLAGRTFFGVVEAFTLDQLDDVAHENVTRVRGDGRRRLGRVARVGQPVDELPRTLGRALHVRPQLLVAAPRQQPVDQERAPGNEVGVLGALHLRRDLDAAPGGRE